MTYGMYCRGLDHAVINPSNTVPEADVTNDATDASLTVAYPPLDGPGQNAYNEFTIQSSQFFPTSSGAVAPGGTLLYRLTVANTGSDPAVNVPVRDYLPTGTTFRLAQLDSTASTCAHATTAATKIVDLCPPLQDTIPTCIQRWVLLPPALIALDEVTKQINSTESTVVQKFTAGMQGRFVFINPYDAFNDQCMNMNVTIKTQVYHPPSTVHEHDSGPVNFGCDPTYIASDGNDGGTSPFVYLTPAVDGILLTATQTTADLGVNPNDNGHQCIAKLVWSSIYQKLGWPQSPIPPSTCS